MRNSIKSLSIAALLGGAIVLCPSTASAWSHNEHQRNDTGATAYDVVKILDGDYEITDMMEWDFPQHDYYHRTVSGKKQTVLRWWGGAVPSNDLGDVCFTAKALGGSPSYAKIIGAWWTDENGVPLGGYYPATSMEINFDDPNYPVVKIGNFQAGDIDVPDPTVNPNFWEDGDFTLIGNAAPLHVVNVKAAVVDEAFTPQNLFVENTINDPVLGDQFFDVFSNITIPAGEIMEMPLGQGVAAGQSLVLVADLGNGNYDLFNFVNTVPEPGTAALFLLGFVCFLRFGKRA